LIYQFCMVSILRLSLVLACAAAGPAIAAGQDAESDTPSTRDVYACGDIADDQDRLACYDAAADRLETAEDAGEVTTVTREEVEEAERRGFGLSLPSLSLPGFGGAAEPDKASPAKDRAASPSRPAQPAPLSELVEPVARLEEGHFGKLRIVLANGQVWRQTGSDRVYVPRGGVETARVRRAALGSYMMSLDGGVAFRVKREQ